MSEEQVKINCWDDNGNLRIIFNGIGSFNLQTGTYIDANIDGSYPIGFIASKRPFQMVMPPLEFFDKLEKPNDK